MVVYKLIPSFLKWTQHAGSWRQWTFKASMSYTISLFQKIIRQMNGCQSVVLSVCTGHRAPTPPLCPLSYSFLAPSTWAWSSPIMWAYSQVRKVPSFLMDFTFSCCWGALVSVLPVGRFAPQSSHIKRSCITVYLSEVPTGSYQFKRVSSICHIVSDQALIFNDSTKPRTPLSTLAGAPLSFVCTPPSFKHTAWQL